MKCMMWRTDVIYWLVPWSHLVGHWAHLLCRSVLFLKHCKCCYMFTTLFQTPFWQPNILLCFMLFTLLPLLLWKGSQLGGHKCLLLNHNVQYYWWSCECAYEIGYDKRVYVIILKVDVWQYACMHIISTPLM